MSELTLPVGRAAGVSPTVKTKVGSFVVGRSTVSSKFVR